MKGAGCVVGTLAAWLLIAALVYVLMREGR
jgi:hypothetical protein